MERAIADNLTGRFLALMVDGVAAGQADDDSFTSGSAGFIVEKGTIVADGFHIRALA